jgi:hypothetical protein
MLHNASYRSSLNSQLYNVTSKNNILILLVITHLVRLGIVIVVVTVIASSILKLINANMSNCSSPLVEG